MGNKYRPEVSWDLKGDTAKLGVLLVEMEKRRGEEMGREGDRGRRK